MAKPINSESARVGYGRPPKQSRFRPGQSGNPAGRPKGSRNLQSVLRQELERRVRVTINGEARQISKYEAAVVQLVNDSVKGNARARQLMFALLQTGEANLPTEREAELPLNREEQRMLQALIKGIAGDKASAGGAAS